MNHSLLPKLVPPAQGTVLHAFGDQIVVKLGTAETNGAFALCSDLTPPGGGPPLHFHLHEDELFLVQEGQVSFCVEGKWTELKPGGVAFAPRGSIHTFRNTGNTPCLQWILTTPAGFEVFMARCAAEFAAPGGPDMARIMAISAEHGIHFMEGPAGSAPAPAERLAPG
jgi:mannose-6-phosphate isomerase-like protein (cupin superfamily)